MRADRRSTLMLALGAIVLAAARKPAEARSKRLSIDANLVPPIEGPGILSSEAVKIIRGSQLTALRINVDADGTPAGANETIEVITAAIRTNPDVLRQVCTIGDIEACRRDGTLGLIFGFEAAGQFQGRPDAVARYAAQGVRIMQLSYSQGSPFGSGVLTAGEAGLTPLGREAVDRMNVAGVTIDLSHSDVRTTLDALNISRAPAAITHAGCSAIATHPRNKPDPVLRALAKGGGVVGIFNLPFLVPEPRQPDLKDYIAHLVHALNVCGEDHVGVGSDAMMAPFDTSPANMASYLAMVAKRRQQGVGAPGEDRPPFVIGLNEPDRIGIISDALVKLGVPRRTIDKMAGANWQSLFRETWR